MHLKVTIIILVTSGISLTNCQDGESGSTPSSRDCKIDLAILLDVSGSIVADRQQELGQSYESDQEIMQNWYAMTNFTSNILRELNIGADNTHVALITFADVVTEVFKLSLDSKAEMLNHVKNLADTMVPDGNTNAFGALRKARDETFSIGGEGNRPEVDDVIIMITDGKPTVDYGGNNQILQETASLKGRGFTILAVGVTDKVNATLLQLMVSRPNVTHYFPVNDFQGLGMQLGSIINTTCEVKPVDDFSVDCNVDLAFLLDSSGNASQQSLARNWDQIIDFTMRIARSYTWNVTDDNDAPQISAISFSTEAQLEFDLGIHNDKENYIKALSNVTYLGGRSNAAEALRLAYEKIFTAAGGDRAGVQNVVVLITDGIDNLRSEDMANLVQLFRAAGIHIIVVLINSDQTNEDYSSLATNPDTDFFRIREFNQISSIYKNVTLQTCEQVQEACTNQVDVYFVLDASGSIGEANFQSMRQFVAYIVGDLTVNEDQVRVGLLTFSTDVESVFMLNTFTNDREAMIQAVLGTKYTRGKTNTAAAINYLRRTGFNNLNGDRADVPNVAVILTDGNSNDKKATLEEAYQARKQGIHFITVGIGDWTNVFELQSVASYPYEKNYHPIMSFSQLDNLLRYQLRQLICNGDNDCSSNPCQCGGTCINYIGGYICECPQGCAGVNCELTCRESKDLAIAVDSSGSVGEPNFRKELDFVREVVLGLNFNDASMRLSLMRYATDTDIRFHLNEYGSKLEILNALSLYYTGGQTNTHLALKQLYQSVFTAQNGDRQDVGNVGLIMTDGRSANFSLTWEEAMITRRRGIELLTLGIGQSVKPIELETIATGPNSQNVYTANGFDTVKSTASEIVNAVCNNINDCTQDYCKNGGTAIDLMNRCECSCPSGTSGLDCSRGCENLYDIVLVIDASGSIRHERFKDVLEFIIETIDQFQADDLARFGAVSFSNNAAIEFHLNTYRSKQDIIAAIRQIRFQDGRTNIADALELVKNMFTPANGDRPLVQNHVLVFTDGKPNINVEDTLPNAILLRSDSGAKVTAIGIGLDANTLEIKGIASEPVDKMAMFAPSFTDIITNMAMRKQIMDNMVKSTCDDTNECLSNPCGNNGQCINDLHHYICQCDPDWTGRNCERRCTNQMDVTFVLDFSGSLDEVFNIVVAFAREVIHGLPFAFSRAKVAVITYEDRAIIEFDFNEYITKEQILNAMSFRKVMGGRTNTQEALRQMHDEVFSSNRGSRNGVDNIAVVVTDGGSNIERPSTSVQAQLARNRGIEIYVAAVGQNPDYGEVNSIATDPDSDHVILVPDADSVAASANLLLDRLCQ